MASWQVLEPAPVLRIRNHSEPFQVATRSRSSRPGSPMRLRMGVRFEELDAEDLNVIEDFLKSRLRYLLTRG
jgi:hypothetical protein